MENVQHTVQNCHHTSWPAAKALNFQRNICQKIYFFAWIAQRVLRLMICNAAVGINCSRKVPVKSTLWNACAKQNSSRKCQIVKMGTKTAMAKHDKDVWTDQHEQFLDRFAVPSENTPKIPPSCVLKCMQMQNIKEKNWPSCFRENINWLNKTVWNKCKHMFHTSSHANKKQVVTKFGFYMCTHWCIKAEMFNESN